MPSRRHLEDCGCAILTDGPALGHSSSVWVSPRKNSLITSCPKQSSYQETHGGKTVNLPQTLCVLQQSSHGRVGSYCYKLIYWIKCSRENVLHIVSNSKVDCLSQNAVRMDLQLSVNQPPTQPNSWSPLCCMCVTKLHCTIEKNTLEVPRGGVFSN